MKTKDLLAYDREHVWHPYASMSNPPPVLPVVSAKGVMLKLADGTQLIDGMSSWWSALHGYNHPQLNQALIEQSQKFSHIMFGGLTHEPAVVLAKKLLDITCENLQHVFFVDSGSIAVEVSLKMALQYWQAQENTQKTKFLTVNKGYYGDTFGAMSVCDPVNGMHNLFTAVLPEHIFADAPISITQGRWKNEYLDNFKLHIRQHHQQIAAVIIEPIVQNAGGMNFYHPEFLQGVHQLCDEYNVLLILDEIATGFGRTGTLFAYEQASIQPDILCIGKALTGGMMTLAATLTSKKVVQHIEKEGKSILMHGPTFMANALACSVANASIDLLLNSPWQQRIIDIEQQLVKELAPCLALDAVKEVRCKGAIGVVELHEPIDTIWSQPEFTRRGVWLRPFGRLVYVMPPFIIKTEELTKITQAIFQVLSSLHINK